MYVLHGRSRSRGCDPHHALCILPLRPFKRTRRRHTGFFKFPFFSMFDYLHVAFCLHNTRAASHIKYLRNSCRPLSSLSPNGHPGDGHVPSTTVNILTRALCRETHRTQEGGAQGGAAGLRCACTSVVTSDFLSRNVKQFLPLQQHMDVFSDDEHSWELGAWEVLGTEGSTVLLGV